MKKYLVLFLALIFLLISCEKKQPIDLSFDSAKDLIDAMVVDGTEGESSTTVLAPGSRIPVEELMQAGDALIGKRILVKPAAPEKMVFVFRPADGDTPEQLTVLYSADAVINQQQNTYEKVMLILESDYGSLQDFCNRFDGSIEGKVKTADFICDNDFMPTYASVMSLADTAEKASDSTYAVYGIRDEEGKLSTVELSEHTEHYRILCERFGIE